MNRYVLLIATVVLLAACDSKPTAEPRSVTARGDLADSERSTIELFETISVSAGARGTQILLAPADYLRAVKAQVGPIASSST